MFYIIITLNINIMLFLIFNICVYAYVINVMRIYLPVLFMYKFVLGNKFINIKFKIINA